MHPTDEVDQARRLVAAAHRCVDWDVWGGPRAARYWDALTDRVRAACYAGPTLTHWWEAVTRRMGLADPPTQELRAEVAAVLTSGRDDAVLGVLRDRATTVVLLVRVDVDEAKQARAAKRAADQPQEQLL